MDAEADERIIVNVKGVSKKAWEIIKAAAARQDEPLGSWISRAGYQLANRESQAPREFPPLATLDDLKPQQLTGPPKMANPPAEARQPSPPSAAVVDLLALLHAVGPLQRPPREVRALINDLARRARGMAPRPVQRLLDAPANGAGEGK